MRKTHADAHQTGNEPTFGTPFQIALAGEHGAKEKVMVVNTLDDEKLLTKGEVAHLCRVNVRTVDRWLTAGKLAWHRTPSGRVLFRKRDILTMIARGETSPRSQATLLSDCDC
jgi:hypothetical protein